MCTSASAARRAAGLVAAWSCPTLSIHAGNDWKKYFRIDLCE